MIDGLGRCVIGPWLGHMASKGVKLQFLLCEIRA